ncbi:hypothetical protein SAMN05519103_07539 [Rhizobiales bacterium GAS113]|nr:hypothetical protein SAMN05519103_07539 [Rhizobiales bacterium GAS113]
MIDKERMAHEANTVRRELTKETGKRWRSMQMQPKRRDEIAESVAHKLQDTPREIRDADRGP